MPNYIFKINTINFIEENYWGLPFTFENRNKFKENWEKYTHQVYKILRKFSINPKYTPIFTP